METKQQEFWKGNFGKEYTDRNFFSNLEWESFYLRTWGKTKMEINSDFIGNLPRDLRILEVGCNCGLQIDCLQQMGFKDLYGVDIQSYAIKRAKAAFPGLNILNASGFDLPFKDNFFDVVCTNGVLIHIAPNDLPIIMNEIYRTSKKYIWGFEYFSDTIKEINYRGHNNYLWKADYSKLFMDQFADLKIVKKELYPYQDASGNTDLMYLLEK